MSSRQKPKPQEKSKKTPKKSVKKPATIVKVSLSPIISSIPSPVRLVKTLKSHSSISDLKIHIIRTPKIGKSSSINQISIKSIEKKVSFSKEDDEPSPIVPKKTKGFSMTEEEYNELRLMLSNLHQ